MSHIQLHPLQTPAAWRPDILRYDPDWQMRLDNTAKIEILNAVKHARNTGKSIFKLEVSDFPLPSFAKTLTALPNVLEGGRGFQLLSGLPVASLDDIGSQIMLWGIGRHLGEPEPQDKAGALLHQVTDTGQNVANTDHVRGFQTNNELSFHTDGADIFALLCLRQARRGGDSRLVSSTTVFNELVSTEPELAGILQQPFYFDARAQNPWERKTQTVPVYTYHAGYINGLYKRQYIELAQRFEDVPRLSKQQIKALDKLDEIAADPEFAMYFRLQPGDLLLANNYSCFHARTEYEDFPEPHRRRCMQRLWLTLPNGRPLPEIFADTREWGLTYRRRYGALGT